MDVLLSRIPDSIYFMIPSLVVESEYHRSYMYCVACEPAAKFVCDANHRKEPAHKRMAKQIEHTLTDYLKRSKQVETYLKEFHGVPAVAAQLYEPLFSYLFEHNGSPTTKRDLDSIAARFRWDTSLILLELKLWKAACMLCPPERVTRDVTLFMHWIDCGWKTNKEALRHDKMIAVVMENVVPFLGEAPKMPVGINL